MKKKKIISNATNKKSSQRSFLPTSLLLFTIIMLSYLSIIALLMFTNFWQFVPKDSAMYSLHSLNWNALFKIVWNSILFMLVPDLLVSFILMALSSLKLISKEALDHYGMLSTKVFLAIWITFLTTITLTSDQLATVSTFLSIFALLSFLYKKNI